MTKKGVLGQSKVMYLKKLTLSGFKSFAKKTVLQFPPGITCIVGPNGSGKTNIAECIQWVLGEQSMKSLRGRKGEDLIFSGSREKPRLGRAQVSLFLENSEGDSGRGSDFNELEISRKIYRDGVNLYFINNVPVRLFDFTEFLARARLGQGGYLVIGQGSADALLKATPWERQSILEQATGVREYQLQKEKTQKKLAQTEENLIQVRSLITEITPHFNYLKRQVNKAKKREEIEKKLEELERRLLKHFRDSIKEEKKRLAKEISLKEEKLRKIKEEIRVWEERNSEREKEYEEYEKRIEEIENKHSSALRELAIIQGRVEFEKEKFEKDMLPVDFVYIQKRLKEVYGFLEGMERETKLEKIRKGIGDILGKLRKLFREMKEGRSFKQKKLLPKASLKPLKKKQKELEARVEGLDKDLGDVRRKARELIKTHQNRRESVFRLEREYREEKSELERLENKKKELGIEEKRLTEEVKEGMCTQLFFSRKKGLGTHPPELIKLQKEISQLRQRLEEIGGIDPLVSKEYEEVNKRYQFLSSQSEDLEKAFLSLREIIGELERKIERQFRENFKTINREFKRYFREMFGGGKAELRRKEGIEVRVRLPGKEVGSLSMLSGGERALTSIALLFAIITSNPPPFLVLDEIDAALDEANSQRFSRILCKLCTKTQFIIITHNRQTMEQSDSMYGVVMGDDGVSRLLSLKLGEAE